MNNKKYKTTMGTIAGLMVISGGLFVYENVYKVQKEEASKTMIYLAKEDIQAHTSISKDMFDVVEVSNDSVLSAYVTNINEFVGKELKGGLLRGEPLSIQRLSDETTHTGEMVLKIEPDFVGTVAANDNIRVFVQLQNRETGEITVKKLFEEKKIIDENTLLPTNVTVQDDEEQQSFSIYANTKEVEDYYIAKASGNVIVVKINELDTNELSSEKIEKFDSDSEEVKNATKANQSESEGQAIITYTVVAGDTLDSLTLKFKTDEKTIKILNDGKTEFEAGEMIQVPAN